MTPENRYDTTLTFIEDTPTESPTGAIVVFVHADDANLWHPWSFPNAEATVDVLFIEDTPTESPTGAIVLYVLGGEADGSLIGFQDVGFPVFLTG